MKITCPVCDILSADLHRVIDGYPYYACGECSSIFIEPSVLDEIDKGRPLVTYSEEEYWKNEGKSARERSYGASIARVAEVFFYARRPIQRFIDIGTGPGYLLDSLAAYLPNSNRLFHGVEKFPPEWRSTHPNYHIGALADLDLIFDAGSCIEVVEHLTPRMVTQLIADIAAHSANESIYIINTGLPEFVLYENPDYLDPLRRGHIASYSIAAMSKLAAPHGFVVRPIRGKRWAYLLEYKSEAPADEDVTSRVWHPVAENVTSLKDPSMGDALFILGRESALAYR
jgi:hypothetical protein